MEVHYRVYKSPQLVLVLSQMNPVYIVTPYSLRSILILFSNICLGLPSIPFPSGFPIKILYELLISPKHATCSSHLGSLYHNIFHLHHHHQIYMNVRIKHSLLLLLILPLLASYGSLLINMVNAMSRKIKDEESRSNSIKYML